VTQREYDRAMSKLMWFCGGFGAALLSLALMATLSSAAEPTKCERCIRRCEKLYCQDEPTPVPSPTVRPPTHTLGKTCDYELGTSRTITFEVQPEPILICHTPDPSAQNPGPFVELQTQNHGNTSCADYWLQMYSPNGAVSEPSIGPQPGAIMQRVPGRYVIAVILRSANSLSCRTLTFTVR